MTVEKLRTKLEKEDLLKDKYSINDIEEGRHCLIYKHDEWLVFYYKDGTKHNLHAFTNEEDACVHFYEHMLDTKRFASGKCDCIV